MWVEPATSRLRVRCCTTTPLHPLWVWQHPHAYATMRCSCSRFNTKLDLTWRSFKVIARQSKTHMRFSITGPVKRKKSDDKLRYGGVGGPQVTSFTQTSSHHNRTTSSQPHYTNTTTIPQPHHTDTTTTPHQHHNRLKLVWCSCGAVVVTLVWCGSHHNHTTLTLNVMVLVWCRCGCGMA